MKKLKKLYLSSATYFVYELIQNHVLPNPLYLFFTDFAYVSQLWHKSSIYQLLYNNLRRYAARINCNNYTGNGLFCLYLLFPTLILHESLFSLQQSLVSILVMTLFCIRFSQSVRHCCDRLIFLGFCLLCISGMYLILPRISFTTSMQLVLSLTVYYVITVLTTEQESISYVFKVIFILNLIVCTMNLSSIILGSGFINNPSAVCEIVILTTPVTLAYSLKQRSHSMQYLFGFFLLVTTFLTVFFSQNTAALIGYCIAVVLFSIFTAPRYLALIFLVFPGIVLFALNKFINIWSPASTKLSNIEGILYTALNFWNDGIGFGTNKFLRLYDKAVYQSNLPEHSRTFLQAGYAVLILILWYTLKIIRSAIFNTFKAPLNIRRVYLAILSSIVGFSASALNTSSLFSLESGICYWLLLSVLSAQTKLFPDKH